MHGRQISFSSGSGSAQLLHQICGMVPQSKPAFLVSGISSFILQLQFFFFFFFFQYGAPARVGPRADCPRARGGAGGGGRGPTGPPRRRPWRDVTGASRPIGLPRRPLKGAGVLSVAGRTKKGGGEGEPEATPPGPAPSHPFPFGVLRDMVARWCHSPVSWPKRGVGQAGRADPASHSREWFCRLAAA